MIIIDEEFKNLIQPLTEDEFKGLEESIIKEGCRDKLVLWGNTLIDGHNRYEICQKHGITFETVRKDFQERNQVLAWIIRNQFSRRNITPFQRSELALKLKDVIAQKAKEQQIRKPANFVSQNSVEQKPIDTQKELAKTAGVSHDTIAKVEKIKENAPVPVVEAVRKNDISINSAYQVTKLEPEEQEEIAQRIQKKEVPPKEIVQEVLKRPHVSFNSGNNEWYTPAEFIEAAVKTMGNIDLDPASSEIANQTVKAKTYYTAETNGLAHSWFGNVWLNPPYSSDLIGKFADKVLSEYGNCSQMIILVNNATETEWFCKLVSKADAVVFPKSRVKFYMPDGRTGAPLQGQAILYIGSSPERFFECFKKFGWGAFLNGI